MKLLKQHLINYLNYTNIHKYSSDTKKSAPNRGASFIYHLYSTYPTHQRNLASSRSLSSDELRQAKQAKA